MYNNPSSQTHCTVHLTSWGKIIVIALSERQQFLIMVYWASVRPHQTICEELHNAAAIRLSSLYQHTFAIREDHEVRLLTFLQTSTSPLSFNIALVVM